MQLPEFTEALVSFLRARNRLYLVHAFMAVEIGILMVFTGAPQIAEEQFGPWFRVALGAQAILPGLLTMVGISMGMTSRPGQFCTFFGLLGIAAWNFAMMLILCYSALEKGGFSLPGHPLPPNTLASFGALVYLNLMLIIGVHLIEIARRLRSR